MTNMSWGVACVLLFAGVVALEADTLVLRDGRRVDGELVAVRDGSVEFQERGWRGRLLRLDRDQVRAIELDPPGRVGVRGAAGRPPGLREREVIVSADVRFVDSGIDVRPGQNLYFDAVGTVWWKKGHKDGPAGERNSPYNPGRAMPRRPAASLIGKVGEASADPFFIGSDAGPIRMQSSGRLFLGVNDDYFEDNRGNFRVVVFY